MENIIDRTTAIASLIGDTGWYTIEDEVLYTEEAVLKPTDAEIQAEVTRLQAEYDNNQYQRDRQYPSIGDQLDMIFHAGLGGDAFQAAIQTVKDKYPKVGN